MVRAATPVVCLLSAILISSCGYGNLSAVGESLPRDQWRLLSLADYDYVIKRNCFCAPDYIRPLRVSVRGGNVQNAVYLKDSRAVSGRVLGSLRTVDEWFDYIERGRQMPFFRLEVEYDEKLGHPIRIFSDIRERVADDEQTVAITNLVAI